MMTSAEFGSDQDKIALLTILFQVPKTDEDVETAFQNAASLTTIASAMRTVNFDPRSIVIDAGRNEEEAPEPRLVMFRSGVAEVFTTVYDNGKPTSSSRVSDVSAVRSSKIKEKRIACLKSPFFVGESWLLTGSVPKAQVKTSSEAAEGYLITRAAYNQLTESGNTTMSFVARVLNVRAFERQFVHEFYNTMFKHNLDDSELMDAFTEYGHHTLCTENFEFCQAVHEIKKKKGVFMSFAEAKKFVQPVWVKFIEPEILNISGRVRQKVIAARDEAEQKQDKLKYCDIFDEAVLSVHKNIQKTMAPDFMKSRFYEEFLIKRFPLPRLRRSTRRYDQSVALANKRGSEAEKKDGPGCAVM